MIVIAIVIEEDETDAGAVSIEVVVITVAAEVAVAVESVGNVEKESDQEVIGADRDHAADPENLLPARVVEDRETNQAWRIRTIAEIRILET